MQLRVPSSVRAAAGVGLVLASVVAALPAAAVPSVPTADDEVVEQLPRRTDPMARAQLQALRRQPHQPQLAVAAARSALERARRDGDPRELGAAQAALAPWWTQADAPPAVRLLRALVQQSAHAFAPALAELEALAGDARVPLALRAQAQLSRAGVLLVQGRATESRAACAELLSARYATLGRVVDTPARACRAELDSLLGDPAPATRELAALQAQAPSDPWLALLRAELAQRQGDAAAAESAYALATAAGAGADVYAVAARADWLLEQGRAVDAAALLQARGGDADALQLRAAIAARRLARPDARTLQAELAARFDAARLRGETLHAREEARYALDVLGDASRALELARLNWRSQREVADALLLARAAVAAGDRSALRALKGWLPDPGRADRRLAALLKPGDL